MNTKTISLFVIVSICLPTWGCIEKPERAETYTPFEIQNLDSCLAIIVDLSGSFQNDWQRDGRAHKLFFELINQFFTDGMGLESKVIIGQISKSDSFVLFDGTPMELTNRFRSPESLNTFLQEHSDPQGSRVYQSTKQMFDYLSELSGVDEKTRMMAVVLSDMKDSESNLDQRRIAKEEMAVSLKAYSETGGGVALYFVAEDEKNHWRLLLKEASFSPGSFVIEGQLTDSPQLPSFE